MLLFLISKVDTPVKSLLDILPTGLLIFSLTTFSKFSSKNIILFSFEVVLCAKVATATISLFLSFAKTLLFATLEMIVVDKKAVNIIKEIGRASCRERV